MPTDRPNIICFLTDQQRADHLGAYGNRQIRTPNIDRLAAEGVTFTESYVANPVCMPNRASMWTGRYPKAHGVRENGIALRPTETVLPDVLRRGGYQTASVGKLHLAPFQIKTPLPPSQTEWDKPTEEWELYESGEYWANHTSIPTPHYGIEEFCFVGGHGPYTSGQYKQWLEAEHPGEYEKLQREFAAEPPSGARQCWKAAIDSRFHYNTFVGDRSIDFLRARDTGRPFFLWCSFPDPHHPFSPPRPYCDMYDPASIDFDPPRREGEFDDLPAYFRTCYEGGMTTGGLAGDLRGVTDDHYREIHALTYGMISMVDDQIGRVVAEVERLGLKEDTIMVFFSDHGDLMGDHWLINKGPFLFRGLVRVPTIWRVPGAKRGGESPALVSTVDLMPTLLDFAGLAIPNGVQGFSCKDILTGDAESVRDWAYVEYDESYLSDRLRQIRSHDWALTAYANAPHGLLFDLRETTPTSSTTSGTRPRTSRSSTNSSPSSSPRHPARTTGSHPRSATLKRQLHFRHRPAIFALTISRLHATMRVLAETELPHRVGNWGGCKMVLIVRDRGARAKAAAYALLAAIVLMASLPAGAQYVPSSVGYQGRLTDSTGQPVPNGTYQVQFTLYSAEIGGMSLWTSSSQSVTTTNGMFAATLQPLASGSLAGLTDVWLETVVGGTALAPRTKLTSVPFALRAGSIDDGAVTAAKLSCGAGISGAFLTTDGTMLSWGSPPGGFALPYSGTASSETPAFCITQTGAGLAAEFTGKVKMDYFQLGTSTTPGYVLTANSQGQGRWQPPTGGGGGITGSGTDGYVPLWSGTSAIGDSHLFQTADGAISVNSTQAGPGIAFQVDSGNVGVRGTNNFQAAGDEATVYLGDIFNFVKCVNGSGVRIGTFLSPNALAVANGGSVGIGTTAPQNLLHVTGSSSSSIVKAENADGPAILGRHSGTSNYTEIATSGAAVHAVAFGPSSLGVYAQSTNADGVRAESAASGRYGVVGTSTVSGGYGVWGENSPSGNYGYLGSGAFGVYGRGAGSSGKGVCGEALGLYGVGVQGHSAGDSSISYGGYFSASGAHGVGLYAEGGASGYGAVIKGNMQIINHSDGTVALEMGEGLDYAEGFDVSSQPDDLGPGSVLVIDEDNPGKLRISTEPYDSKVAGIVAGAKDLGSGVRLGVGSFDHNVALAGRVYCNVDATANGVRPGDLLTTSPTPGHAMKAVDRGQAQGAILGKAMERLEKGHRGQILVLVTLQ